MLIVIFLFGFINLHCKKNSTKNTIKLGTLSALPIAMDEFTALAPIGFVSPPGHVFPNDHMGFYYVKDNHNVIIYSPGNIFLTEIKSNIYNQGQANESSDYALSFGINGESSLVFGHISQLSPKLMAAFGNSGMVCEEYQAGNATIKACKKSVSINLKAGEIIGYSNKVLGQQAMDMGMYVNNKPVSPLDYFAPAIRKQLESRVMGAPNTYNDGLVRTTEPIGGEAQQDIPGTLQGIWLQKGFPKSPESKHIAFVKDYITPEKLQISLGNSVPIFGPGVWKFDQQNTGNINRAFVDVNEVGKTYCYDPLYLNGGGWPNNSLILRLEDTKTLVVETRNCNCSEQLPYTFTNAKITFVREY